MLLRVTYRESYKQHYDGIAECSCPQDTQAKPHQVYKISFQMTLAKKFYKNMSEVHLKYLNM